MLISLSAIVSAVDLHRARMDSTTVSKYVSPCKKKSYDAYTLCRKELAVTEKGRLACAKQYVATFPKCFFPSFDSKKSCGRILLDSFAQCVLESFSYGEIFACNNEKDEILKKCNSKGMEDESEASFILNKRENVQACNNCYTHDEMCRTMAGDKPSHDFCITAFEICRENNNCNK